MACRLSRCGRCCGPYLSDGGLAAIFGHRSCVAAHSLAPRSPVSRPSPTAVEVVPREGVAPACRGRGYASRRRRDPPRTAVEVVPRDGGHPRTAVEVVPRGAPTGRATTSTRVATLRPSLDDGGVAGRYVVLAVVVKQLQAQRLGKRHLPGRGYASRHTDAAGHNLDAGEVWRRSCRRRRRRTTPARLRAAGNPGYPMRGTRDTPYAPARRAAALRSLRTRPAR